MSASTRGRRAAPYTRPTPGQTAPDGSWLHDLAPGSQRGRGQVASAAPTSGPVDNTRLLISNLHYEVSEKDLNSIFGTIGSLVHGPTIRYDRSGRSTGIATVQFAEAKEAIRAKNQLDGVLAKGQPLQIRFDSAPVLARRGPAAADRPSTNSLLNRMTNTPKQRVVSAPAAMSVDRAGPVRNGRLQQRGGGGAPRAKGRPVPSKPKTAEDLDRELEAYLGEGEPVVDAIVDNDDVDMAA